MSSSPVVAELDAALQGMLGLKPPGVSGSRIASITALCVSNVQSESVLIQKIFTHFKKTPGTHKLGVLYVVDSVTRKWTDQAKQLGQQAADKHPQDGTFAAGVKRVTELMPVLMNDIIASAPPDQKEKIKKLIDIWEKGQTFPPKMLDSFKEKLQAALMAPSNAPATATTPPGSPPPNALNLLNSKPAAAPASVSNSIMETLANIARQSQVAAQSNASFAAPAASAPAPAPAPAPAIPQYNMLGGTPPANSALLSQLLGQPQQFSFPGIPNMPFLPAAQQAPPPVVGQPLPYQMPPPVQSGHVVAPPGPPLGAGGAPPAFPGMPPVAPPQGGVDQNMILLIQSLAAQNVPLEQITAIVAQFAGKNPAAPAPASAPPQYPPPGQNGFGAPPPQAQAWAPPRPEESRDQSFADPRQPSNRPRGRSRSRSPPSRHWDAQDSPRGRDDRSGYGEYGRPQDREQERGRGRGGGRGSDFRQRSPQGRTSPPPPPRRDTAGQAGGKWIEFDAGLPAGHIKVLSRTLFVGGVTCTEAELRAVFGRYGEVQTCIVNKDKRHAFVKMFTRQDSLAAKEGMERDRTPDNALRTRWGVGFGPRDCSDYQTGISVIPISKLTEADRKWMLTAPYGGSGGEPIQGGMVVEEPDIEIGAGVSSKAISRRMQTDRGGLTGPRSTRQGSGNDDDEGQGQGQGRGGGGGGQARGRFGRGGGGGGNRRDDHQRNGSGNFNAGGQPVMPEFPFGLTKGPNGMPIFPSGFSFPAPDGQANNNF